ncbi:UNVERIFIED_CONTAM: hypothetical protein K2H54_075382 [Gekko kuhli]
MQASAIEASVQLPLAEPPHPISMRNENSCSSKEVFDTTYPMWNDLSTKVDILLFLSATYIWNQPCGMKVRDVYDDLGPGESQNFVNDNKRLSPEDG